MLLTSTRCTRFDSSLLAKILRSKGSCNKRTRFLAFTRFRHEIGRNNAVLQQKIEIPTSSSVGVAIANKSWVDCLPTRVRPYLYLTRIDKPIGTVLLYLPCSAFFQSFFVVQNRPNNLSMVDNDGVLCTTSAMDDTPHLSEPVWNWRAHHARGRMHDQ